MIKQSIYNLSLYLFSKNYYLLSYILFYSKNYAKKYLNIFFSKYRTNDFIVCKQKSSSKLFKSEITSTSSSYEDSISIPDKTKIVYFMSNQYQYGEKHDIEFDLAKRIVKTSSKCGVELKVKYFSPTKSDYTIDTNIVENDLNDISPEYLILQDEWINNFEDEIEKRVHFIKEMKEKYDFKIIVMISDPYNFGAELNVFKYLSIADKLLCLSSWSPLYDIEIINKKIIYFPCVFGDEDSFYPLEKTIDLFFAGAEQPSRLEILSAAGYYSNKFGLNAKLNLHNEETIGRYKLINKYAYIDYLRRSRSVINISMKGTKINGKNIHIINGRVTDVIMSGALLIQYQPYDDETLTLNQYFTPGLDYLTFSSRKQLYDIIRMLKNDANTIHSIALNGRKKCMDKYSAMKVWQSLLKT